MDMVFNIKKTFGLDSRKLFVIGGVPEFGDLNAGSKIVSKELKLNMPIHSIEAINSSDNECLIGIAVIYESTYELELLKKLKEGDSIFVE